MKISSRWIRRHLQHLRANFAFLAAPCKQICVYLSSLDWPFAVLSQIESKTPKGSVPSNNVFVCLFYKTLSSQVMWKKVLKYMKYTRVHSTLRGIHNGMHTLCDFAYLYEKFAAVIFYWTLGFTVRNCARSMRMALKNSYHYPEQDKDFPSSILLLRQYWWEHAQIVWKDRDSVRYWTNMCERRNLPGSKG